jgi:hypothetical protein
VKLIVDSQYSAERRFGGSRRRSDHGTLLGSPLSQ